MELEYTINLEDNTILHRNKKIGEVKIGNEDKLEDIEIYSNFESDFFEYISNISLPKETELNELEFWVKCFIDEGKQKNEIGDSIEEEIVNVEPTNYRVSTCTITTKLLSFDKFGNQIQTFFDISTLLKYIERVVKDFPEVKSIKIPRNGHDRFYNQFSFVLNLDKDSNVNIKIFRNGSIQMTGVRKLNTFDTIISKVKEILNKVKGVEYGEIKKNEDGLFIFTENKSKEETIQSDIQGVYQPIKTEVGGDEIIAKKLGFYEIDQRSKNVPLPKLFIWDSVNCNYHKVDILENSSSSEKFVESDFTMKYISKGESDFTKLYYNKNGERVKQSKIKFDSDTSNLKLRFSDNKIYTSIQGKRVKWFINSDNIYSNIHLTHEIGHIITEDITEDLTKSEMGTSLEEETIQTRTEYNYYQNSGAEILTDKMNICLMNAVMNINYRIDRSELTKFVQNKGNTCVLNTEGHQAVNIKYFIPRNSDLVLDDIGDGICRCKVESCEYCKHYKVCGNCRNCLDLGKVCEVCLSCETCIHTSTNPGCKCQFCKCSCKDCDCNRITVMCFQSGSVIISGAKSTENLDKVYNWFSKLVSENYILLKEQD